MCGTDIFLGILALLFPPLPVWVKRGLCSADSLINIALCCLGVLPGVLHAWYIIASSPDPTYDQLQQQDSESGRVTHYYIQQDQPASRGGQEQRGYGTVGSAPTQQFPAHKGATMPNAQGQYQDALAGGSSTETPPTYDQAVKGDNKVQTRA